MADQHARERVRRLMGALYREEFRASEYQVYRRRAGSDDLRGMLESFLQVEDRVIRLIEGHLLLLGAGVPGEAGTFRRLMRTLGRWSGGVTALRGTEAMLRRIRVEERRGAEHYARQAEWDGWTEGERATLEGHHCDQRLQDQWVTDLSGSGL